MPRPPWHQRKKEQGAGTRGQRVVEVEGGTVNAERDQRTTGSAGDAGRARAPACPRPPPRGARRTWRRPRRRQVSGGWGFRFRVTGGWGTARVRHVLWGAGSGRYWPRPPRAAAPGGRGRVGRAGGGGVGRGPRQTARAGARAEARGRGARAGRARAGRARPPVRPSRLRGTTSSGVPPAPERAPLDAPRAGRARQRVRLLARACQRVPPTARLPAACLPLSAGGPAAASLRLSPWSHWSRGPYAL
jgi:hypothetical protein